MSSGRSRNAASASCGKPRRRRVSTNHCLLYPIGATIPVSRLDALVHGLCEWLRSANAALSSTAGQLAGRVPVQHLPTRSCSTIPVATDASRRAAAADLANGFVNNRCGQPGSRWTRPRSTIPVSMPVRQLQTDLDSLDLATDLKVGVRVPPSEPGRRLLPSLPGSYAGNPLPGAGGHRQSPMVVNSAARMAAISLDDVRRSSSLVIALPRVDDGLVPRSTAVEGRQP